MTSRLRRLMPGLLAVLVVLALAPGSFAQVTITLTPTPSGGEVATNHMAQTADPGSPSSGILVQGSVFSGAALTTTTLQITFPATITSSPLNCTFGNSADLPGTGTDCATLGVTGTGHLIPPEDPISIVGQTGIFSTVGNPKLNTSGKRIDIDLPGFTSGQNQGNGFFRVLGVRVDANGLTAPATATASLSSSSNNYILQTTSFNVINSVGPGIASVAIGARSGSPPSTSVGTAAILTNRSVSKGTASIVITSGFAGAWRSAANVLTNGATPSTVKSTRIQLTFNSIPTGVTIAITANPTVSSAGNPAAQFVSGTSVTSNTTVTSTSNTALLEILSPSLSISQIEVDVTGISLTSTAAVGTPGSITMTASMAPFCTAGVDANGVPTEANGYPCFTEAEVGPVTVVNILPTQTTMLIPLAMVSGAFDTGISIANTSADPFSTTGGSATPSPGTLRFDFFPTNATGSAVSGGAAGTPFSLTTSATTIPTGWSGFTTDGTVAPGATAIGLLSQLLSTASHTGNFTGYIFVTANFLNGHGQATVSDFRTTSFATNVLVLPPPATVARSTPSGGFEGLHF